MHQSAEVPSDWKKKKTIPIFKKGKRKDTGNYRLISLTSVPSKIIEQILLETMTKHMQNTGMLSDSQHGFVMGKLCLIGLVAFHDRITSVDKERATDATYLDLYKAFDTALHNIPVSKLERHGFDRRMTQ